MTRVVAVDVGVAEIGTVDSRRARVRGFNLAKHPHELSTVLCEVLDPLAPFDLLAVGAASGTCGPFETRIEGLQHVLASVKAAAVRQCPVPSGGGRKRGWPEIVVFRSDGRLAPLAEALADPGPCSCASWLSLGIFAGRLAAAGRSLLVHVGSATTDLVPIQDGHPRPAGLSENERLVARELVSSGVCRTGVVGVARDIPFRGTRCPISTEPLATTRDAYVVLGELEERPDDHDTADGRPATVDCSVARLARLVCSEPPAFGEDDARAAAAHILDEHVAGVRSAIDHLEARWGAPFSTAIISGPGEFVARKAVEGRGARVISLRDELGPEFSCAATAYAIWRLACDHAIA